MGKVYRGTLRDNHIRFFYATSSDITNEVARRFEASYLVKQLLARFIPMGLILQENQKQGWVTVKLIGDGDVGNVELECNESGDTRVYVAHPQVEYEGEDFLNIAKAIGKGRLEVIKDFDMKQHFSSQVELVSSKIGEDFAYFFKESEQVDSLVVVSSSFNDDGKIKTSNALVLQLLPNATEEDYQYIEHLNIPSLKDIEEGDVKENLEKLLGGEILTVSDYRFKCHCSLDRVIASLASLDEKEIVDMINSKERFEIVCNFCNQKYLITEFELNEALKIRNKC
ncbi:MAG: Hsp33 family molecular chaperone HslO [Bacilli bacterium]|nr:Hsp33 family molecular chaperone HslO [Bacilli bacterium]